MARILYVEDNDDNIYMLKRRLSRVGHDVLIATDGQQGLQMAQESLPDLILMDLKLPVVDGWEASRRLKADPATRHIPIIALSASAMNSDAQSALDAGCDDFEFKPVDFQRLLEKIDQYLGGGQEQAPT